MTKAIASILKRVQTVGQTVLNAVANTDLVLASRMEVPASSECSTTPMQCERVNIDAETNG